MNMLDIDSLVDSLVSLATWPHIWNYLDKRPAYSTLNYWSILLPCQLQVKLTGTPPRSRPSGLVVPFLSPERKLGIYSARPLPDVGHYILSVEFSASTQVWHAWWDHNRLIRSRPQSSTWKTTTPSSTSTLKTCLTTRRRSLSRQRKNSKRSACCLIAGRANQSSRRLHCQEFSYTDRAI